MSDEDIGGERDVRADEGGSDLSRPSAASIQRALWEFGWWLVPCPCHWYGRILWRVRQRVAMSILRRYPEDYLVEVDGPRNDPEGTIYTFTNDSTSNYSFSLARHLYQGGETDVLDS